MKAIDTIYDDCENEYPKEWWFLVDQSKKKRVDDLPSEYITGSFVRWTCNVRIRPASMVNRIYVTVKDRAGIARNETGISKKEDKHQKLLRAKAMYDNLLPSLIQKHKGKYVAIVEGNVEIDTNKDVLLDRVVEKYGYVTMYFDQVSQKQKIVKLSRRPRLRKR